MTAPDALHPADAILAELAATVQSEHEADVLVDATDLLAAEYAGAALVDRLRGAGPVSIGLQTGTLRGRIRAVGAGVIVLVDAGRQHVIPVESVQWVQGAFSGLGAPPSLTITLGSALRELGDQPVELRARGLTLARATIEAVCADHVEFRDRCDMQAPAIAVQMAMIDRITSRIRTDGPERTPWSADTCE